ncbi:MAG TPA: hypothetical protein VGI97_00500 [Gemmatimonadaceae bacterium]|jgi:hypothetical protein
MISPAAAELIRRARTQLQEGIAHAQRGDILIAEVWLRAAFATLGALHALLDAPAPPLRKLVVAGPREDADEPEWFARKANDPEGAA